MTRHTAAIDGSTNPQHSKETFTLLRIKRKRTQEPLDALVFSGNDDRSQKRVLTKDLRQDEAVRLNAQSNVKIFKFSKTVLTSDCQFDPLALLQQSVQSKEFKFESASDTSPRRRLHPKSQSQSSSSEDRKINLAQAKVNETKQERYKVIGKARGLNVDVTDGPKVEVYEAVREGEEAKKAPAIDKAKSSSRHSRKTEELSKIDGSDIQMNDEMMSSFLSMVQDYLSISAAETNQTSSTSISEASSEDDFVYDIYIQESPVKVSEEVDGVGSFESLEERLYWEKKLGAKNVATLTWEEESLQLIDDSADTSDGEDYDSDDSNAEDWYGNDYPDEECLQEQTYEESDDSEDNHWSDEDY